MRQSDISKVDIAHMRKSPDGKKIAPHLLIDHLRGTAQIAKSFAEKFDSGLFGELIGFAHDAGKGRSVWQEYLERQNYDEDSTLEGRHGKIPHAIYGAKIVENEMEESARIMSYCIAGHHSGLPDWSSSDGGRSSLKLQLEKKLEVDEVRSYIRDGIKRAKPLKFPRSFSEGLDLSLWTRMLYSCLVDADFLDTERYMDQQRSSQRGGYPAMGELLCKYESYIKNLRDQSKDTEINKIRNLVQERCINKSGEKQGIFSLTVPTGGGKTLSSLGFALSHAKAHGLDRVIYVVPYTSIIEQNSDVFKRALGEENVVEHHSNILGDEISLRSRLSSENWDSPIVVTTSVQFFESLFSSKPSRTRKLHNIAKSVVILDEAQLMPIEFLEPIIESIQLLAKHYGTSVVLSTATQPALGKRYIENKKFKGLENITEIMGNDLSDLDNSLKRVEYSFPSNFETKKSWEQLAEELQSFEQVLCILSDRKSCRELHKLMPEGTYHLSGLMCGEHRSAKIKEIRGKLEKNEPVRVVSTQLIEAGVDIDFPVVYRSMAGLDSIAQAGGRCNREGKLEGLGKVVVFNGPRKSPAGILRKAEQTARNVLSNSESDPMCKEGFERYFSELYWNANSLDENRICSLLKPDREHLSMAFRTASRKFHIIDDSQQKSIIVPYGGNRELIEKLKSRDMNRSILRKLQRFIVTVWDREFQYLFNNGSISEVFEGVYVLGSDVEYSEDTGLILEEGLYDPDKFIQ